MDNTPVVAAKNIPPPAVRGARTVSQERTAMLYARFALGAAFLSAVADRFGLWGKYGGWGNFAPLTQYTEEVNSSMPAFIVPFLAGAATAPELALGIALIIGFRPRRVALGAATLLFLIGTAMAISFGIKSRLDYSGFSASAGALLLASHREGSISSSQG
ncbi:MAG: DoxX family membrane protein [Candidatus Sulfotelmatobacter sp.]